MPEYLALQHFHSLTRDEPDELAPPSAEETNEAFLRMERAGIARIH